MNITRRLLKNGELKGVLIKDNDEEYPIFLETLYSTIILDSLMESGWKLCGLPYDFRKDGRKMDDLPSQEFNPTQDEEQEMFDMLDNAKRYTFDELKSKISKSDVEYVQLGPGAYTINTREEFLNFLDVFDSTKSDANTVPLNYFVHPEARFTIEDFDNKEYRPYIEKLNEYRKFSFKRYRKFIAWAKQHGLKENANQFDILEFYFSWGIDGLDIPFISKMRKTVSLPLGVVATGINTAELNHVFDHDIALLDASGEMHVRSGREMLPWEYNTPKSTLDKRRMSLKDNETIVTEVQARTTEDILEFTALTTTIKVSTDRIIFGNRTMDTLRVIPDMTNPMPVNSDLWPEKRWDEINEIAYMRALVHDIHKSRIIDCDATSVKALQVAGLTERGAVMYIADQLDMDRETPRLDEQGQPMPTLELSVINQYYNGSPVPEEQNDLINQIINGEFNIDSINASMLARNAFNVEILYNKIYAIHNILGIDLDDIREKVLNMGDADSVTFEGNGLKYVFVLPMDNSLEKGYLKDINTYRLKAARDASEYLYVLTAVREMGTLEAHRHVGVEVLRIEADTAATKMVRGIIEDKLIERVQKQGYDDSTVAGFKAQAKAFAVNAMFEIILKGTITYPKVVGGDIEVVENDLRASCSRLASKRYENITVIANCNFTQYGFHYYVANAFITPEYVVPIKGAKLYEVGFSAIWRDYTGNMSVYEKLRSKGVFPTYEFTAWENFALDPDYRLVIPAENTTLYDYYKKAMAYRQEVSEYQDFVAAPHPNEYLFRKNDNEESSIDEESVNETKKYRDGLPSYKLVPFRQINNDDFKFVYETHEIEREEAGVKPFYGYTSEDFYLRPDALDVEIPMTEDYLAVSKDFIITEADGKVPYTKIAEYDKTGRYPICNLYGRKYIFRDYNGKYWETTI